MKRETEIEFNMFIANFLGECLSAHDLAVKAFEYFESRVCDNCRHYSYSQEYAKGFCYNEENTQEDVSDNLMQVTEDFGCNKFEQKTK